MKKSKNNSASQIIEYLLIFAAVVGVVVSMSGVVGERTSSLLGRTLNSIREGTTSYSYTWVPRDCGDCSKLCDDGNGPGEQICSYVCERNDGIRVDGDLCPGTAPEPQRNICNVQLCPESCVWGDWPEDCDAEPSAAGCGPCIPESECATNGTRTVTRSAVSGVCNPLEGVREESCTPEQCAECGNGILEPGEQCDGSDFGIYDGGCTDDDVKVIGGKDFTGGTISCDTDCQLNMLSCEYVTCTEENGTCGGGDCAGNKLAYTESCQTFTYDGTPVGGPVVTELCKDDDDCTYECAAINMTEGPVPAECDGAREGVDEPDQQWDLRLPYEGESCPIPTEENPGAAACMALCPNDVHMATDNATCFCEGNWIWDGSKCDCPLPFTPQDNDTVCDCAPGTVYDGVENCDPENCTGDFTQKWWCNTDRSGTTNYPTEFFNPFTIGRPLEDWQIECKNYCNNTYPDTTCIMSSGPDSFGKFWCQCTKAPFERFPGEYVDWVWGLPCN